MKYIYCIIKCNNDIIKMETEILGFNWLIRFYPAGWDSETDYVNVNTKALIDLIKECPNYFHVPINYDMVKNSFYDSIGGCYNSIGFQNMYNCKSVGGLMFAHLEATFLYMSDLKYKVSEEESQKIIEFFGYFVKNVNEDFVFDEYDNINVGLMHTLNGITNKERQYQRRLPFFQFIWRLQMPDKSIPKAFENRDLIRHIATFI